MVVEIDAVLPIQNTLVQPDDLTLRMTKQRQHLLDLILHQDQPFTAAHLYALIQECKLPISRPTLFRTLDHLIQRGIVERIHSPESNECDRYVLRTTDHPHYLLCTRCNMALPFAECDLDSVLHALAQQTGFTIEAYRLEVFGHCSRCR